MNKQELIAAGFVPTVYPGQAGEFLAKRVLVKQMPYACEHLVDNDQIFGDMFAVTELTPDGQVQMLIEDADYIEGPIAADSEEGVALLKDAMAAGQ